MKTAGIIAEFNPFHNGHALLIKKVKDMGAECIVAVMSGSFVQRGEPSVFRSDIRTRCALACGADLVFQLPVTRAVSGAKGFALGGVEILDALGCTDTLCFGSECGDTELLKRTAEIAAYGKTEILIKEELKKGISYAAARENAVRSISPECAGVLASPNDILAVEYISALNSLGSGIEPIAVKREGAAHDSAETDGSIASASMIRELIRSGADYSRFVPERAGEILRNAGKDAVITDLSRFESLMLYALRTSPASALSLCPDISEGIENRIASAAEEAVSLEELYLTAKAKRYSHARIRRICVSRLLGITAEDASAPVPYIRVLGFDEKGRELLRNAGERSSLPVITKAAELKNAGEQAQKFFELESRAGDIYSLCTDENSRCGYEKRFIPVSV